MSVYTRPDSRFYWVWLEGTKPPIRFATKIPIGSPYARRETKQQADAIYRAAMGDLARGVFKLPNAKHAIAFAEYARDYLGRVTAQHRGHLRERSMLHGLIKVFGGMAIDAITTAKIEAWKASRAKVVKPSTVNRELDVLKAVLQSAVPQYLEANPAAPVRRYRVRTPPIRILTHEAEEKILTVASPAEKAYVLLGLDALLRAGDARSLRAEYDHRTYLEIVDPKTAPYKVPVSTRLRAALDALSPVEGWYFPRKYAGRWQAMNANTAFLLFRQVCERAKVPTGRAAGITFHGLRHTGATRAASVVKLRAVQMLGGWASLRQLERYDHPNDPELVRGVEAIGSRPAHAQSEKTRKRARSA